jgi:hypothetical protein
MDRCSDTTCESAWWNRTPAPGDIGKGRTPTGGNPITARFASVDSACHVLPGHISRGHELAGHVFASHALPGRVLPGPVLQAMIYYARHRAPPRPRPNHGGNATFIDLSGAATILMHIVAIGWMYVVLMMSLTETSFVAGVMTFVFYGAVPVGIIWYLSGSGKRRARARATQASVENQAGSATPHELPAQSEAVPQAPEAPPQSPQSPPESSPPPRHDLP